MSQNVLCGSLERAGKAGPQQESADLQCRTITSSACQAVAAKRHNRYSKQPQSIFPRWLGRPF